MEMFDSVVLRLVIEEVLQRLKRFYKRFYKEFLYDLNVRYARDFRLCSDST